MSNLFGLNRLPWYVRVPIKWMIFTLTVLAVCFPYPHRLARHIEHWGDPNALIEPDAPALKPLAEELRSLVPQDLPPREALETVERFVHTNILYEWDWITWGTADYLPTVTEAIEKGKEDCDGRAVVAASLLRTLGYESEIVTDFMHVWVKTDKGELMGPGKKKAVLATEQGLRFEPGALMQVPRALAYGLAVFPLDRELIVLAVLWLLLLHPKGSLACGLTALALLANGLLFLRIGSVYHSRPVHWMQIVALANLLGAFLSLFIWARRYPRLVDKRVDVERRADPG